MRTATSFLTEAIRLLLPLVILGMGVIAFAAIANRREPPQRIEREATIPVVETVPVQLHDGGLDIEVDGTVVPHRDIHLSAEVGGRITRKTDDCRPGRYVTQGTLLLEIDPRKYELEVERLVQELDQADATMNELDVEAANTKALIELAEEEAGLQQRQLERIQRLSSRGATSDSELDEARRAELSSRNNLVTLRNQLRMLQSRRDRLLSGKELAQAKLDLARLDLERTKVRAPIDGMIVDEAVQQDDYVQTGSALVTIEDTSAAEVGCSLRMEELNWIWLQGRPQSLGSTAGAPQQDYQLPPTPVTVVYQLNGRRYSWDGVLSRYEGIGLDEKTRTVPCRVLVSDPRDVQVEGQTGLAIDAGPRALVRGMYVKVLIHARPQTALLRVPERSVQPGNIVWRVRDGKLDVIPLRNTHPLDGGLLVPGHVTPLEAGDRIVVTPLSVATAGMAVEVQSEIETPEVSEPDVAETTQP